MAHKKSEFWILDSEFWIQFKIKSSKCKILAVSSARPVPILLLIFALWGCGGGGGGGVVPGSPIDASGGKVTAEGGPVSLASVTVPAGALASAITISISPGAELTLNGYLTAGPAVSPL